MFQSNKNKKLSIPTQAPRSSSATRSSIAASPKLTGRRSVVDKGTNVQVMLRFKGGPSNELYSSQSSILEAVDADPITEVLFGPNNTIYSFDRIFKEEASQQDVYDSVASPILSDVLNGYSCTIFAYGQTGTGKTYTMEGDLGDSDAYHELNAGVIPRTIQNLFQRLRTLGRENHVMISMLELYNEELRDLLCPSDQQKPLNIYEDGTGVKVQNVQEHPISSAAQGLTLLKAGINKRMTAATNCNEKSSRSHSIFTITVYMKNDDNDSFQIGKLNLVDLAGSENSRNSGSENLRAREAASINRSLLTLGRVINSLVDKTSHIPYRESKLTRLLKDSLGGHTKTCIIATVAPTQQNQEEIHSTLDYASHAKGICNRPQSSSTVHSGKHVEVLVKTIEQLQEELRVNYDKSGVYQTKRAFDATKMEIQVMKDSIKELQMTNEELRLAERRMKQETVCVIEAFNSQKLENAALSAELLEKTGKIEACQRELGLLEVAAKAKDQRIRDLEAREAEWERKFKAMRTSYDDSLQLLVEFKEGIMEHATKHWASLLKGISKNADEVDAAAASMASRSADVPLTAVACSLAPPSVPVAAAATTTTTTAAPASSSSSAPSSHSSRLSSPVPSPPSPPAIPSSSNLATAALGATATTTKVVPRAASTKVALNRTAARRAAYNRTQFNLAPSSAPSRSLPPPLASALPPSSSIPDARHSLPNAASKRKTMSCQDETSSQKNKKQKN
ncbi:MAG: P-loop containing nucleoside triphosphate hydrolase protein [Benjaminiella poitrasii]|nr:MAG: P-loop containing nucleoside triphosphate hydrolase protein [Benjaminiella poitrasii]